MSNLWTVQPKHPFFSRSDLETKILASENLQCDTSMITNMFTRLATVTCMSAPECQQLLRENRRTLVRRYRHALEQSLAQAGWMTTQSILVLQSLVLYIFFATGSSRHTWIINGIALSLAQAMGLHSNASSSLDGIETEVRRRVWWMLCQTDVRASDTCGLQSHVPFTMDTELPLNINDTDLEFAGSVTTLHSRTELTEMTVSLAKIEMAKTKLLFKQSNLPSMEREAIIRAQLRRYEDTYLKYYDRNSELQRLYYLGTRFMMARLSKMMYDTANDDAKTEGLPESLILYHADVLEIAHQLPNKYRQHGWFFRCKNTQWHAVAYLLIQLCEYTEGSVVDRAWDVVEAAFASWDQGGIARGSEDSEKTDSRAVKTLWKPLLRLFARARSVRAEALRSRQGLTSTPSTLSTGCDPDSLTPEDIQAPAELLNNGDQLIGLVNKSVSEDIRRSEQLHEGIVSDPFFGSMDNFNTDMNWEQLDDWVQNFQDALNQQDMDWQDQGALNWW
ncbi:hypothetical protein BDV95DRAFT_15674 [Massariosphaeria phaeospora]|uniref:Xylanolytic transcriptional activator regulatory domain-containing protein n=1 Tax=Massariosphaeria phaeospora TaxID=100035 RepID=A0A7C8II56_9PLEO|nr:hypothetical protein BDV95DRAFT_15674 [Massariosphaeria phaeospora]